MVGFSGDTIAAIATAIVPQQGSVGIVRLSGAAATEIARQIFQIAGQQPWESHRILYGYIRDPESGRLVDEALLLPMLAPRSYTREDVVELHCHGGLMPVQQTLQLCIRAGARLAEPGEFTLRAFLNGRLDLSQAESIADLISAQSPQAAQAALGSLQGKLGHPIRQLRDRCLDILAEVEARIDFEDDLPPLDLEAIAAQLTAAGADMQAILSTADRGELLRTGLKIAIVGRPNVGKSSLLNAWSRCDRAIVTDLPGTTRDLVESQLIVGGIPVQVLDTAGIRETSDQVEQIGVERSRRAAQSADLVLLTIDASAGWSAEDQTIWEAVSDRPILLVINKRDRLSEAERHAIALPQQEFKAIVWTAAAQQQGIEDLEAAILAAVGTGDLTSANWDWALNQRQVAALTTAQTALRRVEETLQAQLPLDFWTIDLREAIAALGSITGEEIAESMLDLIFSRFCIGK
ncbi:tRNA uridine-5-carboxymethylaminomethyl(34) synthesis GTPase MnmE [Synechococcus elongatus]|uniref:tRNA modification GTPase MnmE n=1 Tax=Synechococcus elongatus (strain ATCC 33912 / PCC 7942 / FACHB-805) TaxID=1140 RepID=MNME_SYNE7|nr:tRNA uridine-5-carboxymethylaminomethyl(34) synthesis GTPase MnmE [Synechococcus elongatus]Q8KPU2.3 RecName: Full=tRNA modification GTPase MnmE [Synechococcus elongatus PCC 7942 = FACHB-805]ABB57612.1 tRNA modification GTPase trmE [Synechococcus elongatus PCC 7942 = FACHB-805]AJD57954.1 tRNA modification GTPase TrmE [Synechococcus elongatus UTEX 2973]MBD2588419.1 tRNA uridine-5-carboxymethylaminomethyl(34) synthesis GTPase MnmE [Synechococcus elongatus FACHB-242]MBD2689418.1 tRNA uridine-5-